MELLKITIKKTNVTYIPTPTKKTKQQNQKHKKKNKNKNKPNKKQPQFKEFLKHEFKKKYKYTNSIKIALYKQ